MSNLLEACIVEAEKSTGIALPNARATLARLERRAKDWAKGQIDPHPGHEDSWACFACGEISLPTCQIKHARDCDAAIILDLERESVG